MRQRKLIRPILGKIPSLSHMRKKSLSYINCIILYFITIFWALYEQLGNMLKITKQTHGWDLSLWWYSWFSNQPRIWSKSEILVIGNAYYSSCLKHVVLVWRLLLLTQTLWWSLTEHQRLPIWALFTQLLPSGDWTAFYIWRERFEGGGSLLAKNVFYLHSWWRDNTDKHKLGLQRWSKFYLVPIQSYQGHQMLTSLNFSQSLCFFKSHQYLS